MSTGEDQVRVIVSDIPGTSHANTLKETIIKLYNAPQDKVRYPDADISNQVIVLDGGFFAATEYAKEHPNVIAIARSTSGVKYFVDSARQVYPRTQCFVPMGSNSYRELNIFEDSEPPVIITCGAGDDEDRNNTAWGNGLEFWDCDWNWYGGTDASSFSNGFIVGKALRLYDELKKLFGDEITWWQARWLLRESAFRKEINRPKDENGNPVKWHKMNGYGRPSIDWALYYATRLELPKEDPYMTGKELGPVGNIDSDIYAKVDISIEKVDNASSYEIVRNDIPIAGTKNLFYTDILKEQGVYIYKYRAVDYKGDYSDFSTPTRVVYKLQHVAYPIKDIE